MSLVAIRGGLIQIHKEWVIRSYVLAFAFVNFRWWFDFPILSSAGTYAERAITIAWIGWALPLFVTEVILQWKRMRLEWSKFQASTGRFDASLPRCKSDSGC
jgi:hypothetical protein